MALNVQVRKMHVDDIDPEIGSEGLQAVRKKAEAGGAKRAHGVENRLPDSAVDISGTECEVKADGANGLDDGGEDHHIA